MAGKNKTTPEAQGEAQEVITPELPVDNTQDVVKNEEQLIEAPEANGEAPEVNEVVTNIQPSVDITEEAKTIGEYDGLVSTVSVEFDIPVNTKDKDVTVKILIKYPEDYQGEKFHKDGELKDVSIDTAEIYIKKGIGTITE